MLSLSNSQIIVTMPTGHGQLPSHLLLVLLPIYITVYKYTSLLGAARVLYSECRDQLENWLELPGRWCVASAVVPKFLLQDSSKQIIGDECTFKYMLRVPLLPSEGNEACCFSLFKFLFDTSSIRWKRMSKWQLWQTAEKLHVISAVSLIVMMTMPHSCDRISHQESAYLLECSMSLKMKMCQILDVHMPEEFLPLATLQGGQWLATVFCSTHTPTIGESSLSEDCFCNDISGDTKLEGCDEEEEEEGGLGSIWVKFVLRYGGAIAPWPPYTVPV